MSRSLIAACLLSCMADTAPPPADDITACGVVPPQPGWALVHFDSETVVYDAAEWERRERWISALVEWQRCVELMHCTTCEAWP